MSGSYQKASKLEFRDLILQHIKKILDITTIEFRGGYEREVVVGNQVVKEYIPDTRKQYIQSIESLSDILLPFFDDKIKEPYEIIIEKIKVLTNVMKEKKEISDKDVRTYTLDKLELCRKLFQELNLLLSREEDILKGAKPVYESPDEDTGFDDEDE